MLDKFVWFKNAQTAINMEHVRGFKVTDDGELHFWIFQGNEEADGWGYIISDPDDVRAFLQNVARLDELPESLNVSLTAREE